MNDIRGSDHNKKAKQETNLRSDSKPYLNGPTLMALSTMALPTIALPTMALPTMTKIKPSVLAYRAY